MKERQAFDGVSLYLGGVAMWEHSFFCFDRFCVQLQSCM